MPILQQSLAENRVILNPVSWETFNQLLHDLGNKRASRLAYYQGMIEIMTPLGSHEHNNRFIDDLIRVITEQLNLNIKKMGSLTLKKDELKKGVEPDSCYYLANEPQVRNKQNIDLNIDPPPDLVLEIDITSGSLDKLPIYSALGVPEVWRYDGNNMQSFILEKTSQTYCQSQYSLAFPWLELAKIPPFVQQSLRDGETATLKQFRSWISQEYEKFNVGLK
jgi:Uma2 family endonuclease